MLKHDDFCGIIELVLFAIQNEKLLGDWALLNVCALGVFGANGKPHWDLVAKSLWGFLI